MPPKSNKLKPLSLLSYLARSYACMLGKMTVKIEAMIAFLLPILSLRTRAPGSGLPIALTDRRV